MPNNLLQEAKRLKKTTDKLLYDEGLFALLKKHGKVIVTGAYDLNLMMHGDIDLYVVNKNLNRNKSIEILNKLLKDKSYRGYLFFDHVNHRTRDVYPCGYYIGLRKTYQDEKWNFDIWFLKDEPEGRQQYQQKIKSKLNDKNKAIILKFKKWRNDNNLEIWGTDIYEAVITHNISKLSDLKKYIKDKMK